MWFSNDYIEPAREIISNYPIQTVLYSAIALIVTLFFAFKCKKLKICPRRKRKSTSSRKRRAEKALQKASAFANSGEAFITDNQV
jgi:uncharacterized protein HemY